ncbi:translation initiation factor IF-2 [Candidatus Gottesmanbacteria bacterium RBG_13_37_7]|uniref:Translation initiation factor IF-2 n=1 Tax=Candidatus Gottesmanbacteria bacterium RBG_13_37_7 TaxID=1798369 RepID=A0A1F5YJ69_9BACT|nr:MAG: translation initiation factor IF-2 [Candidatus Gottesmanbacteria bacterium RBG_13_37_7]
MKQGLSSFRPPVIIILGHVDHGKTTLLDAIRKTNIALKEKGGITQHIGAYQVDFEGRQITFIDTPGHEAFMKMRERGSQVADMAVLVVAGNDGVQPQTIESINHIKTAEIPCIVALTKMDLPGINIEKIKKQLTNHKLKLEEFGGDIPIVPISVKTNKGLNKLLEAILLLADYFEIKKDDHDQPSAVVIESSLSKNKGPIATIIVRSGEFGVGDNVTCEKDVFKIRAILDWQGGQMKKVSAGTPAEILGWPSPPVVGSTLFNRIYKDNSIISKNIAVTDNIQSSEKSNQDHSDKKSVLKIILKTDTTGSLEAIVGSLPADLEIISKGVGNINESDVFLAKTTQSLIIGFNLKPGENIIQLARTEKIIIKTYFVIYELFSEIKDVISGLQQGILETILGEAKIITTFNIKKKNIAGIRVISGRIAKGDQVKIMNKNQEVGRAKIKSLRSGKEDINRSEQGQEAGVLLNKDITLLTDYSIISIG